MATCRDEILAILPSVSAADGSFTPADVVAALRATGSAFADSTVRTHVTSRMCADAPDHHARVYDDLVRVAPGRYRLRRVSQ